MNARRENGNAFYIKNHCTTLGRLSNNHYSCSEKIKKNESKVIGRTSLMIIIQPKASINTLHVSLNFDPSEKLSTEKLQTIAKIYMKKIGFDKQPFLVYHHRDAGHPHIHIVSTNIQKDGSNFFT